MTDGGWPIADLVFDSSGDLFGSTTVGGTRTFGTIFEIAQGSTAVTTLASFTDNLAPQPNTVTLDAAGDVFGTTYWADPTAEPTDAAPSSKWPTVAVLLRPCTSSM